MNVHLFSQHKDKLKKRTSIRETFCKTKGRIFTVWPESSVRKMGSSETFYAREESRAIN